MLASCDNKRSSHPSSQHLQEPSTAQIIGAGQMSPVFTSPPGVSNCYIFKSQLQEYAQKVQLPTPVYETIKEGPSHQPSFKSTVIVDGVRYDSLPGFLNRKAAEQSAAEIALMELSKRGASKESISVPVHETGLCKNLLQDYTQKMNFALPTYICKRDDSPGKPLLFSCTVEIGGIQYIGAAAKTKKEAEIKAARTALLAIRSSPSIAAIENPFIKSQYTVVPQKRKVPDTAPSQMTEKPKKPKRSRLRKKQNPRNSRHVVQEIQLKSTNVLETNNDKGTTVEVQQVQEGLCEVQVPEYGHASLATLVQDIKGSSDANLDIGEASAVDGGSVPQAFGCQQQIEGNINSSVSLTASADGIRDTGIADVTLSSSQLDASVSDLGISLGEAASVMNESTQERKENTLMSNEALAPVSSDILPAPKFDSSISETVIGEGERTSATLDPNNWRNAVSSDILPAPMFDSSISETVIGQGEQTSATADPNDERNAVSSDVLPAPMFDSSISETVIGQGERTSATADPNNRRNAISSDILPAPKFDSSISETVICQGELTSATSDPNSERNAVSSSILPAPTFDSSISETMIGQGELTSAKSDPNNERNGNSAATNVSPVVIEPLAMQESGHNVSAVH